jgi:DNA repair photolyase
MDAGWLHDQLVQGEEETKERYKWFMRPEPKEVVSDVEIDPENGLRYRWQRIGMVRNAADENKREVKVYIEPLPHIVLDEAKPLQGWYGSKVEESERARPRPCFTEAVLTEPYGGFCLVGCAFCYINSGFRGYRGTGLVTVPKNYGTHVRSMIGKMRTSAAGYFSSFTDPFMELEKIYHNTQGGAEAFVENGLPIFFLSRLSYPDWAYDLLRKNPYSYAQKSLNTSSESDWRKLSPGAISLKDHLEEIAELRRQGIYTSIQVNPIVAGITSIEEIETLFGMLKEVDNNHVIVKFVEAGHSWAPTMVQRMEQRFGKERAAVFRELFTCNIGSEKTIDEGYRLAAHDRLKRVATKLGMTYATCYEYRYARDAEGNILSKTGVSVGRNYATSDQCHGHRVPLFTRERLEDRFQPVPDCPPSGCLYCADENKEDPGEPRCGNELFGQAKALRGADYKNTVTTIGKRT